ncbi:MAG: 2-amino-4-hydroxy-6-hydroxymethyldihydropteridine diphosphokinase [Planctomycetota bacterium]|nr:2-amino-4-hydroxy-6-hydroxymethyldihydropteridine diphosphokinase [Planctomycetota bacterium]
MTRPRRYLLSLGSNIEPERWVPRALELLGRRFDIEAVSSRYDVRAVGAVPQPAFVNLAVRLRTDLSLRPLRAACRHIEALCERVRSADRFAPRTLDLDVVFDGSAPAAVHDDLLAEPYVLVPCAQVWPDARLGANGATLELEAAARFPRWAEGRRREDA